LRVSEAIQMRRNQLDVERSRLWVARLKGRHSVEHPIAGDELRAIKHYLATRTDNLPWLFVSERQAQLTRQAVNYIVRSLARPRSSAESGRTCCVTAAAIISPTRAPI
jgi:type 1 fimbriae regulatory protein FimB